MEDLQYIGGANLNWFPYEGQPPATMGMPAQVPAGPLGTPEGQYLAMWHYPYSPYPTQIPHVYLPHKFYAYDDCPSGNVDKLTGECKDTPEYKEKQMKGFYAITAVTILGMAAIMSLGAMAGVHPLKDLKNALRRKK